MALDYEWNKVTARFEPAKPRTYELVCVGCGTVLDNPWRVFWHPGSKPYCSQCDTELVSVTQPKRKR